MTPGDSRLERSSRRQLLRWMGASGLLGFLPRRAEAGTKAVEKDSSRLPLVGAEFLQPGDVLHLRVNGLFTSYHSVRPVIHGIQLRMLTSASRKRRSLYYEVLRQHRALGLPHHEPIAGATGLLDTVRDLTDTGHTTIYVGNGEVIETTGEGCRVRRWRDIDTARYVVMRAKDPKRAALVAKVARAIGGSQRADDTLQALHALSPLLPPSDRRCIDGLRSTTCQAEMVDSYDMISASKGFFGKLKDRHHLGSPTALDSMLYLDEQTPPALHRDTVCSTYVALVLNLVDRAMGWSAIGQSFDESAMSDEQRRRWTALQRGQGCSTHVRPEWVLPAYLDLGMQVSGEYDILGQFVNIGASLNTGRTDHEGLALARPHADYISATEAFVRALSPEERGRIQLPLQACRHGFVVTDSAMTEHAADKARTAALYGWLLAERAGEAACAPRPEVVPPEG